MNKPNKINFPIETPLNCNNLSEINVSKKFTEIEEFFVDKTGMDNGGLALTPSQFINKVEELKLELETPLYWAITNEGQFQVYVTIFTKS